jgi:two-component system KDP operon response regulator KdpE
VILAVDDEAGILRVIKVELQAQGFQVLTTTDPEEAVQLNEERKPDIALLDIRMPEVTGIQLMKRLRQGRQLPVILVTAMDRDSDKIRGLELGADDYVVKPFGPEELGARIRAVLRRVNAANPPDRVVRAGNIEVDLTRRIVKKDGEPLSLTRTEWQLLQFLAMHPGKVLLYSNILGQVWGAEYREDSQYLRVWISRLRAKLEQEPAEPKIILTHQGVGYTFVPDAPEVGELEDELVGTA